MFYLSIFLAFLAVVALGASAAIKDIRTVSRLAAAALAVLAAVSFGFSMFTTVGASRIGVVTTFGKVADHTLAEGAHFVLPWARVTEVYLGQHVYTVKGSEASSKDLQSVHADLVVNYTVTDGLSLYRANTALNYPDLIVGPAVQEVFKAITAQYTAEELVSKRSEVSQGITAALQARLRPYFMQAQVVNLTNFGFSKSFNDSIEEKVTASQKAETAKRNLERIKAEAESRIAQAEGEAKAIAIQSAAIEKSGGAGYVQLQAIQKWDGKLPQYVTSGAPMPFVNTK